MLPDLYISAVVQDEGDSREAEEEEESTQNKHDVYNCPVYMNRVSEVLWCPYSYVNLLNYHFLKSELMINF